MANIQTYIDSYWRMLGSILNQRLKLKELHEKFVSWEIQTLNTDQQKQARENIGVHLKYHGKVGKADLLKGTHTIYFDTPFELGDNYALFVNGSTSAMSVNVIIVDDTQLDRFTIKVVADCTVRWEAKIIIQF